MTLCASFRPRPWCASSSEWVDDLAVALAPELIGELVAHHELRFI
jgi:hypothetical protein